MPGNVISYIPSVNSYNHIFFILLSDIIPKIYKTLGRSIKRYGKD